MKRKKLLIIVIAIICLFVSSGTIINNVITLQKHKEAKAYNSEQDLIGSYEDANSETVEDVDNNEIRNLEVNAYFLDEGGNKKRGIYKTFTAGAGDTHSSEYVTLFVDLGLSQDNAYIKNGRISLSDYNAFMIPTLSKGGVIEEVNDNNDVVKLTNISSGNSVHLGFKMKQVVIWDNGEASKEPYSKLNTVKIEGDYYDDSSEEPRHFTKEINWQLDWNADTEIDKVEIVNKLEGNGNLILLNDNRMAAIFEVTSKNKENGAIPVVGEYKMSGFKIHGIAPEITVSDVTVSRNHFSIENSTYDKTSDTLTWKSHRDNADKRQVIDWGFKSYITVVYPAKLYNTYLNGKTDTVETELNLEAKNMAYVNPNIQYKEKSLIDNDYPEPGTRYTEPGNASLKLQFNNHDGKLYKYETKIKEQSKINSELIYYGVDTSAGYKEDCNVTVNAGGNIVSEVKIDWDNNNPAEHSFMDNSGNYYSHEDLKCYTGIYIGLGTMNLLGENGWIEVYGVPEDSNTDNFSRIDRYTTDGKHDYNKKYKKIRIKTSAVKTPGTISLSNLVEINNNKLKGKYTSEVFEKFTRLAASSNAYIKIGDNEEYTDPYSAYTEVDYTTGTLKLNVSGPVKADTYETSTINYSASLAAEDYSIDKSQSSITCYNNPKVLVEFPITVKSRHTKFVKNTLEVTSGGKTMKAKISNRLTKNGKDYFIININGTTNSSIDIKASFDVVPNTIKIKESTDVNNRRIRTFANTTYDGTTIIGNVQGGWWNSTEGPDTYDMNGNGIYTEGDYFYENTEIIFTEPVGVRTVTSLALDGSEEEVLSPGVMELDKNKDGGKEVTVNNNLYNYSDATLKKLKLVGRIPYKGNKFLKSGDDMGSTFDTTMQSGIKLPTGLEGVTVKYSTEEINIKDISSVSNIESKYNWTTNFNTDAKSYMIDFGNTDIDKGSVYNFTYKIKLPETLDYGFASYTSNAILFNVLEEEKEVFATPVESPKVGLSIESQNVFDIDFEKVDKDNNDKKLTGAKYTLTRTDGKQIKQGENWVDSIELGSDTGSTFSVSGLYPEVEYKLEETTAPANYKMQNVVFKIVADENSKWKIEVSEGNLGNESFDSSNSYSIKCKINILEELGNADYKVEYYYQNTEGEYKQKTERQPVTRSDKIGKTVSVTEDDKKPIYDGYELSTTHNTSEQTGKVKSDGTTVLKVYFELSNADYKVEYYYQNTEGEYKQKTERQPVTRSDKIGKTVSVTEDDKKPIYDGYELSTTHNTSEQTGKVKSDGTTVLKVYFDIMKVNYTIEYYFLNDNGIYPKNYVYSETKGPVNVGTTISRDQVTTDPNNVTNKPDGNYLLDDEDRITTERTDSSLVINKDESKNVFKVYFTKGYTVTYLPGKKGAFEKKSKSDIPYGTQTPLLIGNKTGKPGYTFTGWLEENTDTPLLEDTTISNTHVTHDITYIAQWKANENTPYQVWFYYQENGKYPNEPFAKVDRTATTDTNVKLNVSSKVNDLTVTVTDKEAKNEDISRPKTGANYIFDNNAGNILEANVNGDGTTVLKVYFKQIPVKYNFDTRLKDTKDNTLTQNKFTITRAGTINTDETVLWDNKAVSDGVEINENNLLIDTYTYKVTENETPNEKYVNVLNGKYVSVTVAISDEGIISISSWKVCNNDGTEVASNDSVRQYVSVKLEKGTIKVEVTNPVRFIFEVKKKDSEGNNLEDTGISIKSEIIKGQNAAHRTEIETESKNGLQITENGDITGETNKNGVIKYEETWVKANTYTYEIRETKTSGNQYVNILDGYKILVTVKVNSDGTLEIVKNGDKNYKIVSAESGDPAPDNLYKYVNITVSSNSLNAIIDYTGHVDVDITNPVKFNINLIKKDTKGNDLDGTKFTVTRNKETIFDNKEVTNGVEINEGPVDAGTYTYTITENSTKNARYTNILENRNIKLNVKVSGDGHIDVLDQGENNFKVFENTGAEVTDKENVLKFIEVWTEVANNGDQAGVSTINVKVVNPVKYKVDIATATTAYGENKNIDDYFLDNTDVKVYRKSKDEKNVDIYSGQPIKDVECTETPMEAGDYEYYFTQTSTKNNKFVNPLDGKFVRAQVKVSETGMLEIGDIDLFEGTIGDQYVNRLTNDEAKKYIKVNVDNSSDISTLKIVIIDPVRFTVEVKKLDTEEKQNGIEDTKITINSSVVNEQNAVHSEKTKETSESKDGLDINSDGNVSGTTNSEGKVKYEETWVNSNESPELSGDNKNYYTYEITEDETAGNQYVNVLKGYKIIVRVKVSPEGVLTLVDENGKAYNANAKIKFTIVDAKTGKAVATDNIAYNYVSISVENDSLSAVISKTGKLNVDITNPVRFNIDLIKKDTSGEFLSGTKFTVTRGKETIFNNSEVTKDIEIKEDPINAGVYTYYIRENQTNTSFGNRYVNILDGKYIKIKVKVNGNGVIDILDNEDEKNDDYYEVYEDGKKQKVTDDNILKYISVKSHDEDGDGVYTIDVQVINPIRYEIDIITLDTLGNFLNDTNVTLYKDENDGRKELFTGNATDVNKIKKVEKVEIPAEAGTYTYYVKENQAKSERYVNVIDGRYIKIQLTVNSNGMLTVTNELYEGDLGKGKKVETGSVFNYYSVKADNSSKEDVSRLNITLINPVKFVMEVDKYDTAENPLNGTTFEIESPIIGSQKHEHNNEKISGIADDGITSNGVITGVTDNAIEKSPNGNMQRARISYEETWVDANKTDNDYYTYIIKETKTSGAQYVNILEGYQIVLKVHVDAEGNLALKETNGRNYEIVKVDANAENITDEVYKYVKINVSNNKILATLNTEVINPVRYNIAVYQTIYGDEKIKLKNIPVEIQSEFSGNTTLVTDENGYTSMEEKAVWEGKYNYKILQLNEYKGQKVEDEFVNMLDGYYISIDLNVHSDGVIKTMSADGDETTVSYKLYKKQKNGRYEEVDFNDTIVDDFVKVKVTKSDDNVCTLNVYIITPEKYDFKLMKTDIDVLASKEKFGNKYKAISENMNDVEFSVVAKDANGEIVLKNTLSGKDAKTEFEKINTKEQKTKNVDNTDGIILFDNILIERAGTYTFEITEVTPIVEGMIYKDKSESIIITAEIVEENGKYVLKNMQIPQAKRYTIAKNTKITGTETQTISVNVSNERIKGQYDLTLNKVSKLTGKPLDGAVYKVTVEQDGKENKTLYISDGDVLSKNEIIPYVGDENQDITGTATTAFNNIRIEIPETYTIKIEEIKAPETFTKLDDVIELEVTTGIEGEYDDAHYVLKEVKLKEGNHDLISETHSKAEDKKQNINVQIENEFFDLALKQYVTDVNGTEITSRKPEVTVTKEFNDGDATTAEYKQVKDAQRAYAGQEVIYTIEVFNEGIIDGYAEEIVQHLPEGLEFVDDELNKSFGWEYDKANNQVVTKVLSKEANEDNFIPAYNKETQIISSKKIQLKLKVSDNVKLKTKLTTIAEITASLAKDRKETLDRDSNDLVAMPETEKLAEYTENQEDDDDFEKLIIEEFDLAPVKYIKSVNGKDCDERWAKLQLDPERAGEYKNGVFNGFKYKSDNEMLKLKQNDIVVYGINVYNEGSVKAYAKEVKDTIPSGLVFIKDSEINKKYGWKMLDSDGNVTDDVNKAVCVVTDYLANDAINELSIENNTVNVDNKTVEVEFKIAEPNTEDRIIENKAEVSEHDDDQGINPKDRDPEERLQENIEKVYVKIFDLELEQVISSIEVTNTKTNEKTVTNSDEIRKLAKVDIAKSKLKDMNIKVEYTITIKNNGETAGYASEITDYIPEGFTFDSNSNPNWVQNNGYITTNALADEIINPNETKEVKLILEWNNSEIGQKTNISEISKHADENKNSDVVDIDSTPNNKVETEDDLDLTNIILTVKTGSEEITIILTALGFMAIVSLGIVGYKKNVNNL